MISYLQIYLWLPGTVGQTKNKIIKKGFFINSLPIIQKDCNFGSTPDIIVLLKPHPSKRVLRQSVHITANLLSIIQYTRGFLKKN